MTMTDAAGAGPASIALPPTVSVDLTGLVEGALVEARLAEAGPAEPGALRLP